MQILERVFLQLVDMVVALCPINLLHLQYRLELISEKLILHRVMSKDISTVHDGGTYWYSGAKVHSALEF